MKTELTQRDKKLLVFLGIFVIVVCIGYWGIKPAIQKIVKYSEDIEIEQNKKDLDDMKVASLPMMESENKYYEEEILNSRSNFYPMMTSDEIDKMFTGMVLEYNLNAYDMNIDMPTEECHLDAYKYSEKANVDEEIDDFETYDEMGYYDDDSDEEIVFEEEPETGIYMAKVKLRIGGEKAALQKFVDDLSGADKKHMVSDYQWDVVGSRQVVFDSGEYDVDITYNNYMYITINLFMCKE